MAPPGPGGSAAAGPPAAAVVAGLADTADRPSAAPAAWWRRAVPWVAMAAVPWAASRCLVLAALALAHVLAAHTHPGAATVARVQQGLLGWDAGWYQAIATHGYGGAGHQSLRFWPLVPLLGRAVAVLPGVSPGAGLLVVANASQLLGTALLAWLAVSETGDPQVGRRTAWLACLVPAAFVTVMGYAEATFLVLAAATFLALRRRHWWWAAAAGFLAASCRPLGVALVVPAAIEGSRAWWEPWWAARHRPRSAPAPAGPGTPAGTVVARLSAALAPGVGLGAFLGWVAWRYHDGLAPIRIQQQADLHGRLVDPAVTVFHDAVGLVTGHHLDEGLHVPWIVLVLTLLVVVARRLPASYTAFSAVLLVAAVSGPNLDSFERYALVAFPLVIAGALLTASARVERVVLPLAAAGLVSYALLAFMNVLVP